MLNEIGKIRNRSVFFSRRRIVEGHYDRHQNRPIEPGTASSILDEPLGQTVSLVLKQLQQNHMMTEESWSILNWFIANIEASYGADLSQLSVNNFDLDDNSPISEGSNSLIYQGKTKMIILFFFFFF